MVLFLLIRSLTYIFLCMWVHAFFTCAFHIEITNRYFLMWKFTLFPCLLFIQTMAEIAELIAKPLVIFHICSCSICLFFRMSIIKSIFRDYSCFWSCFVSFLCNLFWIGCRVNSGITCIPIIKCAGNQCIKTIFILVRNYFYFRSFICFVIKSYFAKFE